MGGEGYGRKAVTLVESNPTFRSCQAEGGGYIPEEEKPIPPESHWAPGREEKINAILENGNAERL